MNAIILSPGPSLPITYHGERADMVVGVNRAATRFPCTHWCCGDSPLVESISGDVLETPTLVTYGVSRDTLRDHKTEWRGVTEVWTPIAESWLHTSVVNWPWCSFCAAIVYAAWKGAKDITVYGADWEGVQDFDGVEAGKNRSEARWKEERHLFGRLQVILKELHQVELTRIQPAPAMIDGYA